MATIQEVGTVNVTNPDADPYLPLEFPCLSDIQAGVTLSMQNVVISLSFENIVYLIMTYLSDVLPLNVTWITLANDIARRKRQLKAATGREVSTSVSSGTAVQGACSANVLGHLSGQFGLKTAGQSISSASVSVCKE